MKAFDIRQFMHNVHREAGDTAFIASASWAELPDLLRLQGDTFVRAAYRFILGREADTAGLSQYRVRAESLPGKLRILLSLYCSPEHGRVAAWKYTITHFVQRIRDLFSTNTSRPPHTPQSCTQHRNMDKFYCAFENRYRDDFDAILTRLESRYSTVLERTESVGKSALDLGCGRGEAVAFFGAHGFQSTGVDGNTFSLKNAEDRGLNVVRGDLFAHLTSLPADSQAVVSAFHVIEHLPFERLLELIDEAWRVLRLGGVLLLETPNARNLLVTGGDFYRDPTHIRPIFPDTLDFLLNGSGFEGQAFFFDADERLVPSSSARLTEIQDYFHVSRDMAWIGRKTPTRLGW